MRDTTRRRMMQLSGGIALAGMAGCLGRSDDNRDVQTEGTTEKPSSNDNGDTSDNGEKAKTGDDAPDFELETTDGDTVKLDPGETSKPTIVLFADVTSEAAKSHSKTLVDVHEEHGDHARLITVNSNLDASKDDVRAFQKAYGGDWECALGDRDVIRKYGGDAAVTIGVIDEQGKLVARLEAEVSADAIEMFLDAYAKR